MSGHTIRLRAAVGETKLPECDVWIDESGGMWPRKERGMRTAEEIATDVTHDFDEGVHSHEYMILVAAIRAAQREAAEWMRDEAAKVLDDNRAVMEAGAKKYGLPAMKVCADYTGDLAEAIHAIKLSGDAT